MKRFSFDLRLVRLLALVMQMIYCGHLYAESNSENFYYTFVNSTSVPITCKSNKSTTLSGYSNNFTVTAGETYPMLHVKLEQNSSAGGEDIDFICSDSNSKAYVYDIDLTRKPGGPHYWVYFGNVMKFRETNGFPKRSEFIQNYNQFVLNKDRNNNNDGCYIINGSHEKGWTITFYGTSNNAECQENTNSYFIRDFTTTSQ